MPSPHRHRCTIGTIDYTDADTGEIRCDPRLGGCGRVWEFVQGRGWVPDPYPIGAHHG